MFNHSALPPPGLSKLCILPDTLGINFELINNILEHLACNQLKDLEISLSHDTAASVFTFDDHQVTFTNVLDTLQSLTILHDLAHFFTFNDHVLVSCSSNPQVSADLLLRIGWLPP